MESKEDFFNQYFDHQFLGPIAKKASQISSEKLKTKIMDFIKFLNSDSIEFNRLQKIIFDGLPDEVPSLRSLIWKILLNALSLNINEWEDKLELSRSEYNTYKKKFQSQLEILKQKEDNESSSSSSSNSSENVKEISKRKLRTVDHPLSLSESSRWKTYFDDKELLEEIEKDIRRTRTHMHFFFMPSKTNEYSTANERIIMSANKKRNQETFIETNADVMGRILFIFAKRHPDLRYVQGMNEMIAPIFYCFSNDPNPYFVSNLEADTYTCFESLIIEVRDLFIRTKDLSESGIHTKLKQLSKVLRIVDLNLVNHFDNQKVELQYFAFRWYTLFFTQEFEMPDILRLWDSILAEDDKFDILNMICIAIIQLKKDDIMQSDFSGIMMSLQNLNAIQVEDIIEGACRIREQLNSFL